MPKKYHPSKAQNQERGIALFTVIIFTLLAMLLALWAWRSALVNEMITGNDADYQRAFEAAQAMLQDAEFDIRGINHHGESCQKKPGDMDKCRPTPQPPDPDAPEGTPERAGTAGADIYFQIETQDLEYILSTIAAKSPEVKCYKGVCHKRTGNQDFWNEPDILSKMLENGARYGQFTGADSSESSNLILATRESGKGAWYWIEILPYLQPNTYLLRGANSKSNVFRYAPSKKKLWVYRITALARGNKSGTEVVLQSTLSIQVKE